jgi:hypothetical protein
MNFSIGLLCFMGAAGLTNTFLILYLMAGVGSRLREQERLLLFLLKKKD